MKVKLSLSLLVIALMSGAAFAQTVAGKWMGQLSAGDGHGIAQPIVVELKLDGETLSGTVTEGALEPRPIQSPAVDGSAVTFRTVRNFGGSDININWKGQLKGDELTLTRQQGPAPPEAGGGRGGRGGGGGRGGRGGGARGGANAANVPPVPDPQADGAQNAAGQNDGAQNAGAARGGGGRGGRGGGRGGAATPQEPAGPAITLILKRS
jgi:hypothetical protein